MIDVRLLEALTEIATTHPVNVPPKVGRPCFTYRRISAVRELDHSGPVGLVTARYQITAHAPQHSEAMEIADAARQLLDGATTGLGPLIRLVEIENEQDLGYQLEAESWQIALDAIVHYEEI